MTRNDNLLIQRLIHGVGPIYHKAMKTAPVERIQDAIDRAEGCSDLLNRLRSLNAEIDRRQRHEHR